MFEVRSPVEGLADFDRLVWFTLALLLDERKAWSRGGGTSTGIGSVPTDRLTEKSLTPLTSVDEESSAEGQAPMYASSR